MADLVEPDSSVVLVDTDVVARADGLLYVPPTPVGRARMPPVLPWRSHPLGFKLPINNSGDSNLHHIDLTMQCVIGCNV